MSCHFPEVGRLNHGTVFIKLADTITCDGHKNAIEKETGRLVFIDNYWSVIRKEKIPNDHWTALSGILRSHINKTTDKDLHILFQKLIDAGWEPDRNSSLHALDAEVGLKNFIFSYFVVEITERKEGKIQSKK